MYILLIIIGAIMFLFCGFNALSTHTAIKNKENWAEFYKSVEERNLPVSEEYVYKLICKMNYWFSLFTIIGLLLLMGGILLQSFAR